MTDARPAERFGGLRLSPTVILRFAVSLALALLLWSWVTTQQDPIITRAFNDLPVQAPELGDGLSVSTTDLGPVTVRLEGPQSLVEEIDDRELEPSLDVSSVDGPGDYSVPVTLNPPAGTRLERITPRQLPVNVDRPASGTFRLDPVFEQPEDGTRRIGTVQPEVSEVTVGGPQRLVDQVARVVLSIEIGDRTDDFTDSFAPLALDAAGNEIPDVMIYPQQIGVTVQVDARGRNVPVLIQTVGNPAEGYEVVDNVANPATVVLDGPEEALADLVSVSTEPVNIEGATEQVTRRVGLERLAEGVRVVEPASGEVFAVIQVQQRGTTQPLEDLPVAITGLEPGLEAVVEPETLDVVVFAADETLATLRGGDVVPSVSVAGLQPGVYDLEPVVAVPSALQWIRTEPQSVQVVIRGNTGTTIATPPRQLP